jgi:SPP1 gp7 family putative phage head morphogenesis protein
MATQILDQYGNPVSMRDLKETSRAEALYSPSRRDQYYTYPRKGLTPAKLDNILRTADAGYPAYQVELFRDIEEVDGHVGSQFQNRRSAVNKLSYELVPGGDDGKAIKVYEFCKDVLDNLDIDSLIENMMDAAAQGWAMNELSWDVSSGGAVISDIGEMPQEYTVWDENGRLRWVTEDEINGIEIPPLKAIFHQHPGRKVKPWRAGLMRTCCWWWLFKSFTTKDWLSYAEVFGMPIRVGKYESGASQEDIDALKRAVNSLGSDAAAVISALTNIDFIESKRSASGTTVHERIYDKCDIQVSKAVLGQTLTTDVGKIGSLGAASVHNEVRQDLRDADAGGAEKTIKHQMLRPLAVFNFGSDAPVPSLRFDLEEPEDQEKSVKVLKGAKELGLDIPKSHAYKVLSIPQPESGDDVIPGAGSEKPASQEQNSFSHLNSMLELNSQTEVRAQTAIDSLSRNAIQQAAWAFEDISRPVMAALEASNDFEDAQRRTLASFIDMQSEGLAQLLANAIFIAELNGLVSADSAGAPGDVSPNSYPAFMGQIAGLEAHLNADAQPKFLDQPVDPEEAVEFFETKVKLTPEQFTRLEAKARAMAFTVAGVAEEDLLGEIFTGLNTALKTGTTFRDFQAGVDQLFTRAGFEGPNPHHLATVFNTNLQSAYQAGRYQRMSEVAGDRPYWQYSAVMDSGTRPAHAAQDGKVYPANHAYWSRWFPPNGFNCRCTAISLSEDQVKQRGLKVESQMPANFEPDQGWDYSVGEAGWGRGLVEAAFGAAEKRPGWSPVKNLDAISDPKPPDPAPTPRPKVPGNYDDLLRQLGSEDAVREHYYQAAIDAMGMDVGADNLIKDLPITDAVGDPAILAGRMIFYDTHKPKDPMRGRYVGLARDVVENADEVWLIPGETTDGKIVFRRRYIKLYDTSSGDRPQLAVAELERRVWGVFNTFPTSMSSNARKGLLLK